MPTTVTDMFGRAIEHHRAGRWTQAADSIARSSKPTPNRPTPGTCWGLWPIRPSGARRRSSASAGPWN